MTTRRATATIGTGAEPEGFNIQDFIRRAATLRTMAAEDKERSERAVHTGRHGYLASQATSAARSGQRIVDKFDPDRFEDIPPFSTTQRTKHQKTQSIPQISTGAEGQNGMGLAFPEFGAPAAAAAPSVVGGTEPDAVLQEEIQRLELQELDDDSTYDQMVLQHLLEVGDVEAYSTMLLELEEEAKLKNECQHRPVSPAALTTGPSKRPRGGLDFDSEDFEAAAPMSSTLPLDNLRLRVTVMDAMKKGHVLEALRLSGLRNHGQSDPPDQRTMPLNNTTLNPTPGRVLGAPETTTAAATLQQEILLHGLCEIVVHLNHIQEDEDLCGRKRSHQWDQEDEHVEQGGEGLEDRRLEQLLSYAHNHLAPQVSFQQLADLTPEDSKASSADSTVCQIQDTLKDLLAILALPNIVNRRLASQDAKPPPGLSWGDEKEKTPSDDDDAPLMLPPSATMCQKEGGGVVDPGREFEAEDLDFISDFAIETSAARTHGLTEDQQALPRLLQLQQQLIHHQDSFQQNTPHLNHSSPGLRNESFGRHSATNASYPATPAQGPQDRRVSSGGHPGPAPDLGLSIPMEQLSAEEREQWAPFIQALQDSVGPGMQDVVIQVGQRRERELGRHPSESPEGRIVQRRRLESPEGGTAARNELAAELAELMEHIQQGDAGSDQEEAARVFVEDHEDDDDLPLAMQPDEEEEEEEYEEHEDEAEESAAETATQTQSQSPNPTSSRSTTVTAATPSGRAGGETPSTEGHLSSSKANDVPDVSPLLIPGGGRLFGTPGNGSFGFNSRTETQQRLARLQDRCGGILRGDNYYLYLLLSDEGLDDDMVAAELLTQRQRLAERLNRWMLQDFYSLSAPADVTAPVASLGSFLAESLHFQYSPLELLVAWGAHVQADRCVVHFDVPSLVGESSSHDEFQT